MKALTWNKVCCPVDFSEPTRNALRVASDLAQRFSAELVLLHIDSSHKLAEELPHVGSVGAQLLALKEQAERMGAPRVSVLRAAGDPVTVIAEEARKAEFDLVVMGTHARLDREAMLTGSVAEGVVRSAPCPILTVQPTWRT